MKYVALLRGVNAGGNRKVPMAELRETFADMDFSDISTYINSGNVIFSSAVLPRLSPRAGKTTQHKSPTLPTCSRPWTMPRLR